MVSIRGYRQTSHDVTNFFGAFRESYRDRSVYNLGVGEIYTDNDLIRDCVSKHDFDGELFMKLLQEYPGCQGYRELNKLICEVMKTETGETFSYDEIILTTGAQEGIVCALFTYLDTDERVMFPVPNFPYWAMSGRSQNAFVAIPCMSAETFSDDFVRGMKERYNRTCKAVIITSPHNPYGVRLSDEALKEINAFCSKKKMTIILDDVYRSFSQGEWIGRFFDAENTCIIDSVAKRLGVPGLRLGFVRVPRRDVSSFRAVCANSHIGVSNAVSYIASLFVEEYLKQGCRSRVREVIDERQRVVDTWLGRFEQFGLMSSRIDGGIYRCFLYHDCSGLVIRLREHGVIVKDGKSCFPPRFREGSGSSFIRVCVGGENRIDEACGRIYDVIESLYRESKEKHLVVGQLQSRFGML